MRTGRNGADYAAAVVAALATESPDLTSVTTAGIVQGAITRYVARQTLLSR